MGDTGIDAATQLAEDLEAIDQGKLAFETLNNLLTLLARRGVIDEFDIDEMFGSIIELAGEMDDAPTARVLTAQRDRLLAIASPEEPGA